jgi:hypothetical protein
MFEIVAVVQVQALVVEALEQRDLLPRQNQHGVLPAVIDESPAQSFIPFLQCGINFPLHYLERLFVDVHGVGYVQHVHHLFVVPIVELDVLQGVKLDDLIGRGFLQDERSAVERPAMRRVHP